MFSDRNKVKIMDNICIFAHADKFMQEKYIPFLCKHSSICKIGSALQNILIYAATNRITDLLATKIRPKLHHIFVFLSEFFTIFWCNSPLIMVQLRTNFCSQQISASFWCNIGQNFWKCIWKKLFCESYLHETWN